MPMNIPVVNGWLNAEIETRLQMTDGFFYFEDGHLQCVLMARAAVSMRVIKRSKRQLFSTAVEDAVAADPRMRLVVNGSFFPAGTGGAVSPGSAPVFGNLFDKLGGIAVYGTRMEQAACLYLANGKSPRWTIGIGEPPADCTAGIGGLIPLIIGGKPIDDTNQRYANAKKYGNGPTVGRLAVATTDDGKYLLVMLQPDGAKAGLTYDRLRDKLAAAGISDAVLLDGSDSVMMYCDSSWKRRQGDRKNVMTTVGLGFFYSPGTEPTTMEVELVP
jgi:Phosphodiester glycosidase